MKPFFQKALILISVILYSASSSAQSAKDLQAELDFFCQWIEGKVDLSSEIQKWGPLDTVAIREALASEVASQSPKTFNALIQVLAQRYRLAGNTPVRNQIQMLLSSIQAQIQPELLDDQEHPAKKILDDVLVVALGVYLIGIGKRAVQISRLQVPNTLSKIFRFRKAAAALQAPTTRQGWVQLSRAIRETSRSFPKEALRSVAWSLPPALAWAAYDAWREKKMDPGLLLEKTHQGIFIEIAGRTIENSKNLSTLQSKSYQENPKFWDAFLAQIQTEAEQDLLELQFLQKQTPLRQKGKIVYLLEDLKMVQRKIEELLQKTQDRKIQMEVKPDYPK